MPDQPEDASPRQVLGKLLADYRVAAGLNQADLGRETQYSRASIAHIEAGRRVPDRSFWETADRVCRATGALIGQYDALRKHEEEQRRVEFDLSVARGRSAPVGLPDPVSRPGEDALLRDYRTPTGEALTLTREPIDEAYLEDRQSDIAEFVRLDQEYGGTAVSPLIVRAFAQLRRRMDASDVRPGLKRDLDSVAAEVAEVAGWSLFDAEEHARADRFNHEGLKLARRAGDRAMELFILQNMAMHAGHLGQARESLSTADLALDSCSLSPRLSALFHLRKARALAQLRAGGEAHRELAQAKSLYQDGPRDSDPGWAWWINEAEFSWHQGMIHLDLRDIAPAVEFFELASQHRPEPRIAYIYQISALLVHVLTQSWSDAEKDMRVLLSESVGIVGSRRGDLSLEGVLTQVERSPAPSTMRDLAAAARTALDSGG